MDRFEPDGMYRSSDRRQIRPNVLPAQRKPEHPSPCGKRVNVNATVRKVSTCLSESDHLGLPDAGCGKRTSSALSLCPKVSGLAVGDGVWTWKRLQ